MRFANKLAVVTGAGRGMGRAIARRLSLEGATLIGLDQNPEDLAATLDLLRADGGPAASAARMEACDISNSQAVRALFDDIAARAGAVHVLVNNAGIGSARNDGYSQHLKRVAERSAQLACGETPTVYPDLIIDMEDEGWHGVFNVNLHGSFYCTREAVRSMIAHQIRGAIINISSTAAISGEGALHYAASKAALVGMTRSLARELGPRGIRVNNIMPGPVNTPIMSNVPRSWIDSMVAAVPLGRIAEPEDIAGVVAFVASEDAAMITGADIVANGGSYFN